MRAEQSGARVKLKRGREEEKGGRKAAVAAAAATAVAVEAEKAEGLEEGGG